MAIRIDFGRFAYRDFIEADRAAFHRYQDDPRYRSLYDLPPDPARVDALFDLFLGWQGDVPRRHFQFGLFERESWLLCGSGGIRDVAGGTGEVGIELAPSEWGRFALAHDALGALIDFAFDELRLDSVVGRTSSGNRRVARLAERLGGEITATREGDAWMTARGWVEVDWTIRRDRWATVSRPARRRSR